MSTNNFAVTSSKIEEVIAGAHITSFKRLGTVLMGQVIAKWSLVGRVLREVGTAVVTGTGNGTIGSITMTKKTKLGTYLITMTGATTYTVQDPDGAFLKAGADLSAYTSDQINFDITAGGTPFIAGDTIQIPINVPTVKKIKLSLLAATDGSDVPYGISTEDVDATAADVDTSIFTRGVFKQGKITFGPGQTVALTEDILRLLGIDLVKEYKIEA